MRLQGSWAVQHQGRYPSLGSEPHAVLLCGSSTFVGNSHTSAEVEAAIPCDDVTTVVEETFQIGVQSQDMKDLVLWEMPVWL